MGRGLPFRARSTLAVAVLLLVPALAGCGSGKISAQQAAHQLGEHLSPRYHVHCDPAAGSFWNYACTVTPPPAAKDKPYKLKVRVGAHDILDRAVCGARTGTSLNC